MSKKSSNIPDFEELKNLVKNYRVTIVEESSLFELFQKKYQWKIETIPILPGLHPKWKERIFIYFILFYGLHTKDYKKWSLKSFLPLPRGVIMPAIGLSPEKTHLHLLFLNYPATTPAMRTFKTMKESIEEGRRVTNANILRWAQQLFRFLLYIHKNYVTLNGNLNIEQVTLQTDTEPFQQMKEWLQIENLLKKKYKCKEEDLKSIPKEEFIGRQVWIDFFTPPQPSSTTFIASKGHSPERTSSPSSPRKATGELPICDTMHLFGDLRNIDLELTWKLSYRFVVNEVIFLHV